MIHCDSRKKEHQRNYNLGIKSSKSKTKLKLFNWRMEKKILMGTSSTRNSLAWLFFQPPLPVVTEIFRRLAFVQKSSLPIIDPIWICKTLLAAKNRVKTLNFELELKKSEPSFFWKSPQTTPSNFIGSSSLNCRDSTRWGDRSARHATLHSQRFTRIILLAPSLSLPLSLTLAHPHAHTLTRARTHAWIASKNHLELCLWLVSPQSLGNERIPILLPAVHYMGTWGSICASGRRNIWLKFS